MDAMVETSKHKVRSVNYNLLPLKAFYFFYYGAVGSIIPFLAVYLKHLRLTAPETGVITGTAVMVAFFVRPVLGYLADTFRAQRSILLLCCVLFAGFFCSLWFVPRRQGPDDDTWWKCKTQDENGDCLPLPPTVADIDECYVLSEEPESIPTYDYIQSETLTDNASFLASPTGATVSSSDGLPDNKTNDTTSTNIDGLRLPFGAINFLKLNISNPPFAGEPESHTSLRSDTGERKGNVRYTPLSHIALVIYYSQSDRVLKIKPNTSLQNRNDDILHSFDKLHLDVTCVFQLRNVTKFNDNDFERANVHLSSANVTNSTASVSDTSGSEFDRRSSTKIQCHYTCKQKETESPTAFTFDVVFCLAMTFMVVARSFYSSSTSLSDTVTYTLLGSNRLQWGRQRLWGTLGTAIAAMIITSVNDKMQGDNFSALFLTGICLILLAIFAGIFLKGVHKDELKPAILSNLSKVLTSVSVQVFLTKMVFFGMLCGTAQSFIFWFLRDLGSEQITLGVCVLANCVSSLVVLGFASRIITRFGETLVMTMALPAYVIRFTVVSLLDNVWLAVPLELLHGITYSLLWAAASGSTHLLAPVGTQATCQAITGAVYWDLGRGLGSLVTGQLFRAIGARWTFRACGLISALLIPIFMAVDRRWPFRRGSTHPTHQEYSGNYDIKDPEILELSPIPEMSSSQKDVPRSAKA